MRTKEELARLRDHAVALRRAGKSRREIAELLNIPNGSTLHNLLKGEPAPGWTDPYHSRERAVEAMQAYYTAKRVSRDAERAAIRAAAGAAIGALTPRDLSIAGAIAYWCEGAKSKPYRKNVQVKFINSDPGLIMLFLRYLELARISRDRLRLTVHIHESADAEAATRWWADLVGTAPDQFRRPVIKRHQPQIAYPDDGRYHGCLQVSVLKSAALYRQIAGWAAGVTKAA